MIQQDVLYVYHVATVNKTLRLNNLRKRLLLEKFIDLPGAPQSAQASFPEFCRISLNALVALSFSDISV